MFHKFSVGLKLWGRTLIFQKASFTVSFLPWGVFLWWIKHLWPSLLSYISGKTGKRDRLGAFLEIIMFSFNVFCSVFNKEVPYLVKKQAEDNSCYITALYCTQEPKWGVYKRPVIYAQVWNKSFIPLYCFPGRSGCSIYLISVESKGCIRLDHI